MASLAPGLGRGFTLPVSGVGAALRQPTGREDLVLLDTPDDDLAALALAEELAVADDGRKIDWAELTPTDLDAFVMRLRQARIGDRVLSHVTCRTPGCGARVDISFSVETYLDFHQPRPPKHAPIAAEPGWFCLSADDATRFRLPTMTDLVLAKRERDPPAALARTCLRPAGPPARARRRLEQTMAAMAPPLSSDLQGECPDCGAAITVAFEPRAYCLRELRDRARFVYADVDLLASRYHWAEDSILAMPNRRRQTYVELALSGVG